MKRLVVFYFSWIISVVSGKILNVVLSYRMKEPLRVIPTFSKCNILTDNTNLCFLVEFVMLKYAQIYL